MRVREDQADQCLGPGPSVGKLNEAFLNRAATSVGLAERGVQVGWVQRGGSRVRSLGAVLPDGDFLWQIPVAA